MALSASLAAGAVPPATKALCAALASTSLLGFYLRASRSSEPASEVAQPDVLPTLAVVPGSALWYCWTFVSASFLETNVFSLAVSLLTLFMCGRYLEHAWGTRPFLGFCAVSGTVPMFVTFAFFVIQYSATGNTDYLYAVQANGMTALVCAFAVGFKQLLPEHMVKLLKGAAFVRVKYLPLSFLAVQLFFAVVTVSIAQFVLAASGFMTSWVYLRFFKVQDGVRGDQSESFAFASFFPETVQPPIKVLSNITFRALVALRILKPATAMAGAPFDLEGGFSMRPNVRQLRPYPDDQASADRRRALALKQLDMRLTSQQKQRQKQSQKESQKHQQQQDPPSLAPRSSTSSSPPRRSRSKSPLAGASKAEAPPVRATSPDGTKTSPLTSTPEADPPESLTGGALRPGGGVVGRRSPSPSASGRSKADRRQSLDHGGR